VPIGPFFLRRLGSSALAVLGVSLLVFLFLHIVPGDPVDRLAGGDATPEQRAAMARCMNLDRPLPVQFGIFLGHIADGTLGRQCPDPAGKATVMQRVVEVMPYTIELALGGMLVALVLALPLGVAAAVRRGSWVDAMAAVVSLSGISMPTMWMGPLCISMFYVQLGWLPGPAEPDAALALLMPSVVVGTHLMAMLSRMTRSSLVEVLGEDFMTTPRACRSGWSSSSTACATRSCRSSPWPGCSSARCSAAPSSPRRCSRGPGWARSSSRASASATTRSCRARSWSSRSPTSR
jgi:peptide/nickel transport system permease protein